MKKLFTATMYLMAITLSNLAYGMTANSEISEKGDDAFNALQLTRCMVYTDLKQNMQSSFNSFPSQYIEAFGVDDTNSYSQQGPASLSQLGLEG